MIIVMSIVKMISPPLQCKAGVLKFLRFEDRFRDGLVWTVGLPLERKLRFPSSPAQSGRPWIRTLDLVAWVQAMVGPLHSICILIPTASFIQVLNWL